MLLEEWLIVTVTLAALAALSRVIRHQQASIRLALVSGPVPPSRGSSW